MKFVCALALLIASITIFSASAQTTGIENELEELELLITLNQNDYALDGLVSRVRDALQNVVERVKAKLADNKELFEQFRAKIEDVQEKIRDLVKQGGARLQQAVQQIREKLQALVKSVFDKLNHQEAFYEAEQEEKNLLQRVVRRFRELLQRGLDRLKERLSSSYKDILEQVKDKIAEIQEKLQEVGKEFGIRAWDHIHQLREKLVELLLDVKQKIGNAVKGNQYAYYGVEELPQLISTIKRYIFTDAGFAYIRDFARRVQSTNMIVNFVKIFINSQNDAYLKVVLADLFKDAAYFYDSPPADVLNALRRGRDILVTDAGVAVIRKFAKELKSEHQIVNQVVNLLKSVPDAELRRVINELFNGLIGDNYAALEDQDLVDYYEGESLLELMGQRLRVLAQNALERLKEHVSQAKKISQDVAQALREKIEVLQQRVSELGKEVGQKAIRVYQQIRQAIQEILEDLNHKWTNGVAFYEFDEGVFEVARPNTLLSSMLKRLLEKIRGLGHRKDIFYQFKAEISEIQDKIAELEKVTGTEATVVIKSFWKKARDLAKKVIVVILSSSSKYESEGKELQHLQEHISEIQDKIAELEKVTGTEATVVIKSFWKKARDLAKKVIVVILSSISKYESEGEKLQHLQEQLVMQIEKQLVDIQEKLSQSARLQQIYGKNLADHAAQKAQLAATQSSTQNIRELTYLHVDLILLKKEIETEAGRGY